MHVYEYWPEPYLDASPQQLGAAVIRRC